MCYISSRESRKQSIMAYQKLIAEHRSRITRINRKLVNENMTELKQDCYIGLVELSQKELISCENELRRLLGLHK